MQLLIIFVLCVTLVCVTGSQIFELSSHFIITIKYYLGQTTEAPHYFCNESNSTTAVQFTSYTESHSAWQPVTNCSLPQCSMILNSNYECGSLLTTCFTYRTNMNSSICAPAVLCSILEPCNNITYTCASNTSVCVINTCCSPQAMCLPWFTTNFCGSGKDMLLRKCTLIPSKDV
jgi:hypothetical protein